MASKIEEKGVNFNIRIPVKLAAKLEAYAALEERTKTQIGKFALEAYLADQPDPEPIASAKPKKTAVKPPVAKAKPKKTATKKAKASVPAFQPE
jgi:hypothetical protein